jgi:cystathionine beta-lyase
MQYDFDHFPDRRATESSKWRSYPADVLPLYVADMDFVSPQPVIDALHRRVEHGIFGYPESGHGGVHEQSSLRNLLVDRLYQRYQWVVNPEEIILLPGVVPAFNLACYTCAAPAGGVLVQTPLYPPMLAAAKETTCLSQEVTLVQESDGTYGLDWEAFQAAFTSQTRLFILCNPQNPVGRTFRRDELERMAAICLENDVTICSDEIHCDLVYRGNRHIPIASLAAEIAQRTITLMAPSKTFNLAGLQCSFAIIQDGGLRKRYLAARKGLLPWVNLMGLVAAEAAYRDGEEWLAQLLIYLESNRDLLYQSLQQKLPGISMSRPEGTYLAWLDCRQAGIIGNPQQFFLEKAKVALEDGRRFGTGGEGFVRLNFGCPRSLLEQAINQMAQVIQENQTIPTPEKAR